MENFDQLFLLRVEEEGISLNSDILETGLINIVILIIILIFASQDFLGSFLEERKNTIINDIQNAEDRLEEAKNRLKDAQKQLNQVNVVIKQVRDETIATKKVLLEADIFETEEDLKTRFERTIATCQTKERQVFLEIKQKIISLVFNQLIGKINTMFDAKNQKLLVDQIINKLEGDL